MTEICSIIHKCTIYREKNYMNLDFSYPLGQEIKYLTMVKSNSFFKPHNMVNQRPNMYKIKPSGSLTDIRINLKK